MYLYIFETEVRACLFKIMLTRINDLKQIFSRFYWVVWRFVIHLHFWLMKVLMIFTIFYTNLKKVTQKYLNTWIFHSGFPVSSTAVVILTIILVSSLFNINSNLPSIVMRQKKLNNSTVTKKLCSVVWCSTMHIHTFIGWTMWKDDVKS